MRCTYCGAHPADGSWFCPACFRNLPNGGRRRRRRGGLRPIGAALCVTLVLGMGAAVGEWFTAPRSGVARVAAVGGLGAPLPRDAESPAADIEPRFPDGQGSGGDLDRNRPQLPRGGSFFPQ